MMTMFLATFSLNAVMLATDILSVTLSLPMIKSFVINPELFSTRLFPLGLRSSKDLDF